MNSSRLRPSPRATATEWSAAKAPKAPDTRTSASLTMTSRPRDVDGEQHVRFGPDRFEGELPVGDQEAERE